MKSQNAMIIADLKRGHSLTSLMAFTKYGTVSFQKRLSEIRKTLPEGWRICDKWKQLANGKRVKQYWLFKGSNEQW